MADGVERKACAVISVSEKAIDVKRRRIGLFMGVDPFVGQSGIQRTEQRDSDVAPSNEAGFFRH
jgi:hypothetical protein